MDEVVNEYLDDLFDNPQEITSTHSHDHRNTDNSVGKHRAFTFLEHPHSLTHSLTLSLPLPFHQWIETTVYLIHDDTNTKVGRFKLHSGDHGAEWVTVHRHLELFASHLSFLDVVAHKLEAHW